MGEENSENLELAPLYGRARARRSISLITPRIPWLQITYSILTGVFISTGLSLLIIPETELTSVYVIPLFQCVTVFSFIISVVFFILDGKNVIEKRDDIKRIILDLKDIEGTIEELKDLPQLNELNGTPNTN